MGTVIKAEEAGNFSQGIAFNFEDVAQSASAFVARAKSQAQQEATTIRQQAEQEGKRTAQQQLDKLIDERLGKRVESLLPVVRETVKQIELERHTWLGEWEQNLIRLSVAIAERIVRRELSTRPEISLDWIREAMELAKGSPEVRLHLNPADQQAWGGEISQLTKEFAKLATTEVVPDSSVSRGGCRIETRYGSIDQQLEAQLDRIREELS
jgi:flagellar biosynthesis/type III secretory pathway protein FliH